MKRVTGKPADASADFEKSPQGHPNNAFSERGNETLARSNDEMRKTATHMGRGWAIACKVTFALLVAYAILYAIDDVNLDGEDSFSVAADVLLVVMGVGIVIVGIAGIDAFMGLLGSRIGRDGEAGHAVAQSLTVVMVVLCVMAAIVTVSALVAMIVRQVIDLKLILPMVVFDAVAVSATGLIRKALGALSPDSR